MPANKEGYEMFIPRRRMSRIMFYQNQRMYNLENRKQSYLHLVTAECIHVSKEQAAAEPTDNEQCQKQEESDESHRVPASLKCTMEDKDEDLLEQIKCREQYAAEPMDNEQCQGREEESDVSYQTPANLKCAMEDKVQDPLEQVKCREQYAAEPMDNEQCQGREEESDVSHQTPANLKCAMEDKVQDLLEQVKCREQYAAEPMDNEQCQRREEESDVSHQTPANLKYVMEDKDQVKSVTNECGCDEQVESDAAAEPKNRNFQNQAMRSVVSIQKLANCIASIANEVDSTAKLCLHELNSTRSSDSVFPDEGEISDCEFLYLLHSADQVLQKIIDTKLKIITQ